MDFLKIGLIGCGKMMGAHVRGVQNVDNVEITCVCDIIRENAEKVSAELPNHPKVYTNYKDMVDEVDAVMIALPHDLHYECGMFFALNGKHILMEKPLCNTEEECLSLIETCEARGLTLMCAYPVPFWPGMIKLKELVDSGKYGKIIQMSVWTEQLTICDINERAWGASARLGGGQLFSHGCHYIDLFLRFLGQPVSGFHMGSNLGTPWMEKEGTSNVVIQFANGAMGYHFGTWGARGSAHGYDIQVFCEHGFFDFRMNEGILKFMCNRGPESKSGDYPREVVWNFDRNEGGANKQTYREIDHFTDCVLNDKYPLTDAWSSMESNRLIWKLYEAEAKGVTADLSDIKARTDYLEVLK